MSWMQHKVCNFACCSCADGKCGMHAACTRCVLQILCVMCHPPPQCEPRNPCKGPCLHSNKQLKHHLAFKMLGEAYRVKLCGGLVDVVVVAVGCKMEAGSLLHQTGELIKYQTILQSNGRYVNVTTTSRQQAITSTCSAAARQVRDRPSSDLRVTCQAVATLPAALYNTVRSVHAPAAHLTIKTCRYIV